jgi:hypothetical protein
MRRLVQIIVCLAITATGFAQARVRPAIVTEPAAQGRVTTVEVRPHFVTAIRMGEPVNSIAIGDPKLFQVEHSTNEPSVVFVKALVNGPAESNLLISTGEGHEKSLLLVSHGDNAKAVDFVVKYQKPRSFLIAPDYPSELIGETVPMSQAEGASQLAYTPSASSSPIRKAVSIIGNPGLIPASSTPKSQSSALTALLNRQERGPLPTLYGGRPGIKSPKGDHVSVGVGEVIDGGQRVIVLFSAVNAMHHAILLVPPQVELGGKVRHGKIFHHSEWTTSEELPVEDYRLSKRRLGPGERADGVVVFQRPPYKESNETLFLRVAEAGAIDKPALAPIGFGVNQFRDDEASDGQATR